MAESEPTRAMQATSGSQTPPLTPLEKTQAIEVAFTPDATSGTAADPLADPARRRQVEIELHKLGIAPDEIRRLMAARADSTKPPAATPLPTRPQPAAPVVAAPRKKAPRVDAGVLQSFAADLMANRSMETTRAVEAAAAAFPEFRESSAQERETASSLLREASMLRRRERYREAEEKCRQAILNTPRDAVALELLGDIMQGVARVDEALAAYKRAMEADAKRSSAEKKYGDLLMRQQSWNTGDGEAVDKNPWFAVLLSAACPGAGQFHNGEVGKGVLYAVLDVLCVWLIAWSPWGFQGEHRHGGINIGLLGCFLFAAVVYISAMMDAKQGAGSRKRGGASGWGV